MTTLYVDNIAPNLQSAISAPNLTLPAGAVVQFKTTTSTAVTALSTATYTALSGLSMTFTPKYSDSYLYITYSSHVFLEQAPNAWQAAELKVYKGSTAISGAGNYGMGNNHAGANDRAMNYMTKFVVHEPNSTNTQTYAVYGAAVQRGAGSMHFNHTAYGGGGRLTIMEVKQ